MKIKNMKIGKIGSKTTVGLLVLAVIFFAAILPAQAQTYQVWGQVFDTDGVTPVDGVSVTTTDNTTGDSVSATTAGGGYYQTVFGPPTTDPVSTGDTLQIVATYGALTNTTTVTATGVSPQQVDLTLVCDDTTAPVISNPQPSDGSYTTDNTPTISANYSDDDSGIDTSSVVMTVNGVDVTAFATVTADYVSFTPPAQLDGLYTITVDVSDNCTNPATTESWSFTIDTVPPVINSVNLSDDNVTAGQAITVTVNATDANGVASVTAEGISLTPQAGGDIWIGDITAVVGTNVIVNVTAIDVAGNAVHDNTSTYNATLDTEDPVITSVSLSATTVSAGQSIAVTVIATDNAGVVTVTANSVSLSLTSGNATSGTWTGTITAASTSGDHTVTVIACDLYNCTTDTSQSYTVRRPSTGGGPTVTVKAGKTSVSTTETGEVTKAVDAKSADAKAVATLPVGITITNAPVNPFTATIEPTEKLPAVPPAGAAQVGPYAYNFGPTGATFNPAIEITIEFDPAKFDKTPMIYVYEAGAWKALETTVVGNKATAMVTHFSTFVLFDAEEVEGTPTEAPTEAPTAVPTAAPTEAPTEAPTPEEPGFEAVFAIAGLLAVAYLVVRRKKR